MPNTEIPKTEKEKVRQMKTEDLNIDALRRYFALLEGEAPPPELEASAEKRGAQKAAIPKSSKFFWNRSGPRSLMMLYLPDSSGLGDIATW